MMYVCIKPRINHEKSQESALIFSARPRDLPQGGVVWTGHARRCARVSPLEVVTLWGFLPSKMDGEWMMNDGKNMEKPGLNLKTYKKRYMERSSIFNG